jgi:hypothetical protein
VERPLPLIAALPRASSSTTLAASAEISLREQLPEQHDGESS